MNYPTPYGMSDDLALENERLMALVRELKQTEDPWTKVFECVETHEDPYDFDYCETHDRTFELGGSCDHKDLSEIDYLDGREMEQRGRAVRAEMRLEELGYRAKESLRVSGDSATLSAQEILDIAEGTHGH